jgi:putative phosphoribosyl transferase
MATGFTARAAIEVVRRLGARRIVLAVPVAPAETLEQLRAVAEEAIGLETPDHFFWHRQFYLDFAQTSDEEVEALLASPATALPRTRRAGGGPAHQR